MNVQYLNANANVSKIFRSRISKNAFIYTDLIGPKLF